MRRVVKLPQSIKSVRVSARLNPIADDILPPAPLVVKSSMSESSLECSESDVSESEEHNIKYEMSHEDYINSVQILYDVVPREIPESSLTMSDVLKYGGLAVGKIYSTAICSRGVFVLKHDKLTGQLRYFYCYDLTVEAWTQQKKMTFVSTQIPHQDRYHICDLSPVNDSLSSALRNANVNFCSVICYDQYPSLLLVLDKKLQLVSVNRLEVVRFLLPVQVESMIVSGEKRYKFKCTAQTTIGNESLLSLKQDLSKRERVIANSTLKQYIPDIRCLSLLKTISEVNIRVDLSLPSRIILNLPDTVKCIVKPPATIMSHLKALSYPSTDSFELRLKSVLTPMGYIVNGVTDVKYREMIYYMCVRNIVTECSISGCKCTITFLHFMTDEQKFNRYNYI